MYGDIGPALHRKGVTICSRSNRSRSGWRSRTLQFVAAGRQKRVVGNRGRNRRTIAGAEAYLGHRMKLAAGPNRRIQPLVSVAAARVRYSADSLNRRCLGRVVIVPATSGPSARRNALEKLVRDRDTPKGGGVGTECKRLTEDQAAEPSKKQSGWRTADFRSGAGDKHQRQRRRGMAAMVFI